MSGQTDAKYRSSRWPESPEETVDPREPAEGVTSEPVSETTPVPDQNSTLNYRLALGAVIGLGVLIVIGVGLLIVGFARGWNKPAPPPSPLASFHKPVSMGLEPGYRILSSDTQPGRLIVRVRSDTADEIWIIDLNDGHIVATIHGEAPKQ
jgi:hypothetical protein